MFNVRSIVLLVISYVVIPRLTFLPQGFHTLLMLFGPFLIPRVFDWFSTVRATSRSAPVRPTPPRVQNALNLLCVSAVVYLVLSLPRFMPENIFMRTQSHIRTETSVLFSRLRHLRELTDQDDALREKFASPNGMHNRLLYLVYGPDALLNCVWCTSSKGNDQLQYFLYALPKLVIPHIFQLAVLGLSTSSLIGNEGSRFRTHATIAGLLMLVVEVYYIQTYDITGNKRAKSLEDIDAIHWRLHFFRYLTFAVVDIAMGVVLWLTSTNRWLAKPVSIAERMETTTRQAEETLNKMRALGLLTNSVNRDPSLRGLREQYWRTEGQIMAETVQDEAVTEEINKAISKMDFSSLESRVGQVADGILAGIDGLHPTNVMPVNSAGVGSSSLHLE
ncbi:hypothetical protein HBI16_061890 [Parastagonospora nodorum]|nr:hypothetical protein HBI16_061890 [Parastagonospora nodorum]